MKVVEITHIEDGDSEEVQVVLCWGVRDGMRTVQSCLRRGEVVEVKTIEMSEKQFDALPEYEGEC